MVNAQKNQTESDEKMPTIHMDVEISRQLARTLDQQAYEIMLKVEDLQKFTQKLANSWYCGKKSANFLSELNRCIVQLETKNNELTKLVIRVNREIDEWIDIDSSGQRSIKGISDSIFNFTSSLYSLYTLRAVIKEYTLNETWDFLIGTQTGKELEELAKIYDICFVLPDGSTIGNPEGEKIYIEFGDTGEGLGYQVENKIIISDSLDVKYKGVDVMGGILAHEMQHAIDRKAGLLLDYSGYKDITDPQLLEEFLEQRTLTRIGSEVRAFERFENVIDGTQYIDDGITSSTEIQNIIIDQGYESIYENQLNETLYPNYTVDVYYDSRIGEIQINLYPITTTNYSNYA